MSGYPLSDAELARWLGSLNGAAGGLELRQFASDLELAARAGVDERLALIRLLRHAAELEASDGRVTLSQPV